MVIYQGIKARKMLHLKYNPRTMARAIRLFSEVANPMPAKNVGMEQRRLQHAGGGHRDRHGGGCVNEVPPLRRIRHEIVQRPP